MGYCIAEVEGPYGNIEATEDKIKEFEDKYKKIVDLFEGEFFIKDGEGKTYLLAGSLKTFTINSQDFPTLDDGKPNKARARARFFSNIKDSKGDCSFGFGETGFPDEFYSGLYSLCGDEYDSEFCVPSVNTGESGYYSGTFTLIENGISESFQYYEGGEDEDW